MVLSSPLASAGARRLRVALDQVGEQRPGVRAEVQLDERQRELPHRLGDLGRRAVGVHHLLELGGGVRVLALLHERHADRHVRLGGARVLREALDEHPVEPPAVVALAGRGAAPPAPTAGPCRRAASARPCRRSWSASAPAPPAGSPGGCARRPPGRFCSSFAWASSSMRPCSAAMSCSALAALAPTSAELRVSSAVAWSSTLRSRRTCSLYSLSRLSISSSRVFSAAMSARIFSPFAGGHARGPAPAPDAISASGARGGARGGYFQVKSTRRSCAQLGSLVPFASSDPRGRIDSFVPSTPSRPRWSRTDCARRSESARLYSCVPRGSVWPTSVAARPTFFRQSASRASAGGRLGRQRRLVEVEEHRRPACTGWAAAPAPSPWCRSRSTQSSFWAQSFSVLQGFFVVQAPFTQCWPPGHSLSLAQALQLLAMHSWLAGQSALLRQ